MSDREQVDLTDGNEIMPPDTAPAADAMAEELMDDDLLGAQELADAPISDAWIDPLEEPTDTSAEPILPAHRSGVPAKQPLPPPEHKRKTSPAFLGLLLFFATMVTGLGLGYGALTVVGGSPQQLLSFEGLMRPERILALREYPVNLFWLMAVGTGLVACLAGAAVARALRAANGRTVRAEQMVDLITGLDIEDEQGWQSEELSADPRAAAFAANTLGAYRLLQAKMARYIGQEGELHRLEKALAEGTRVDLADGYENPAVGSLADEILRVFDDWVAAVQENEQRGKKLTAAGVDLVGNVSEACAWNAATLERINAQGAGLERLGVKIAKLAEMEREAVNEPTDDVHTELVAGLEEDLEALADALESIPDADAAAEIVDIVDQASKLTFQVAMETARIGESGQKLLPMTQDLEELITAARDLTGGRKRSTGGGSKFSRLFKRMRKRLVALGASAGTGSDAEEINGSLDREIGPLTQQIAEGVRSIARKFPLQTDRLVQLGKSCSELTGAEFTPEAIDGVHPQGGTAGNLAVEVYDPFGNGGGTVDAEQSGLVSDPFASAATSPLGPDAKATKAPEETERYTSTGMSPALAGFSLDPAPEVPQEAEFATAPAAGLLSDPPPAEEPPLAAPISVAAEVEAVVPPPQTDELTLEPFGASSADPPAEPPAEQSRAEAVPEAADTERIYDLAELGAVALDAGPEAASDQDDRVYELSELGAVAVE